MENPHEIEQQGVINRITKSVVKLSNVVDKINEEIEDMMKVEQIVDYSHGVWTGYFEKMDVATTYLDSDIRSSN